MPERATYNFSAGPAALPESVLRETQEALWDLGGSGIGVMEHSHRSAEFDAVYRQTLADCRALAALPDDYEVLFLQGGASTQFFMLPANFLPEGGVADYVVTGAWAEKALAEARAYGEAHEAWREEPFARVPGADEIRWSPQPVYAHYTTNNTIFGTQFRAPPPPPAGAWLACDASSDIFSRPLEIAGHGCVYAGAQKNLGPSGVTLVLLRRDLLEASARVRALPTMQRYDRPNGALFNTPNTLGIFVMGRVFAWLLAQGGVRAIEKRNREKARVLYDAIADSGGFFRCTAREDSRSLMNVTFRTPSEELDAACIRAAKAEGFVGLKGHRSVGGLRASIYNAFPREGCDAFAAFLRHFAAENG